MLQQPRASPDFQIACSPKPPLAERPLLTGDRAEHLAATFKLLANATRLRILHALVRQPDSCVTELAQLLAMSPQAVSNQLQRLVDRGIAHARRNGKQMHYQAVDPCVVDLLDRGLCLDEDR